MEFPTKRIRQYPHYLRHVTTLPWEIKKSISGRHSADMEKMQTNLDIFGVYNMETFSKPIANKIFHVTVPLLIYYCDQFMASEIRHSRCPCSVCQQTTW